MDTRRTLHLLGIDPKRSLGQNFMVEPTALSRLADAAEVGPADTVLEVGAGLGALTDVLAERARRVVALEIDIRLIAFLRRRYAAQPHVEVVLADVLQMDPGALLGADAAMYKVVANLPYYITTAILRHLLENSTPPRLLALTMQREVAERITARPGAMSLLAVSVQFYGAARIVARLKPGHFFPRPEVESAIVRIEPHPAGPPLPLDEAPRFFEMVRAGFSQPRKQVKNSLAAGLGLSVEAATGWLEAAGIAPTRRAETLALDEWLALYAAHR